MKKILFAVLSVLTIFGAAIAGKYTETETIATVEILTLETMPQEYIRPVKTCDKKVQKPVRVKTHTEVIDHYQVYQPVTIYKPMGSEIKRRIVPATKCSDCR